MKKKFLLAFLIMFAASLAVYGQTTADHTVTLTINSVALLALDDITPLTLTIGASTAGAAVTGETQSNVRYLRYTTLVSAGGIKKITLISDANPPAGTSFEITAAATLGTGTTVAVSNTGADLITGIGSGHTGTAIGDGAALSYAFGITDPALLDSANSGTLTLTYTLTDQ